MRAYRDIASFVALVTPPFTSSQVQCQCFQRAVLLGQANSAACQPPSCTGMQEHKKSGQKTELQHRGCAMYDNAIASVMP